MITRLDPDRLAGLQTTWSIIAIVAFVLTLAVVQRAADLARYRWTFLGVALLVLPLVPGVGSSFGGARIWVSIGPVNFQPGEFAKIAFAIFFASYLADNRQLIAGGRGRSVRCTSPSRGHSSPCWRRGRSPCSSWSPSAPRLVAAVLHPVRRRRCGSPPSGSSTCSSAPPCSSGRQSCRGGCSTTSSCGSTSGSTRVDGVWQDDGYQIVQALWGMSDGGLMGTGLGRGSPDIVPVAESDFIFTSIGEELGMFGAAAVLMSYLLIVGAGLRVALRTDNAFEKLLAVGLTTIMGIQAFIIVAGVIKLVPLTGITLPFVSYGGSSLVSNYTCWRC